MESLGMGDKSCESCWMSTDPPEHTGRLHRLGSGAYVGFACVHWTMAMENRSVGWLNDLLHARLREAILHSCARYGLVCAVYTLMPDHAHFLFMGVHEGADQRVAVRLLRRQWNLLLGSDHELQRQPFDHLLREEEREREAFQSVAHYILENPVRASLVARREDWPFSGCMVPGYPSLDPRSVGFWESFWMAHAAAMRKVGS